MSSYRPFFVLTGLRGFQPYIPLRVLCQLGQKEILPNAEDTQNFVWEVAFEDRDRESEAQKIWGGSRTLSSKAWFMIVFKKKLTPCTSIGSLIKPLSK